MPKQTQQKHHPTIAQVVTVYTMTDGTARIIEHGATGLCPELPIYCETPQDVLDYLKATDALVVNPSWYEGGVRVG